MKKKYYGLCVKNKNTIFFNLIFLRAKMFLLLFFLFPILLHADCNDGDGNIKSNSLTDSSSASQTFNPSPSPSLIPTTSSPSLMPTTSSLLQELNPQRIDWIKVYLLFSMFALFLTIICCLNERHY